ncbi:MAG: 7-cyano-7-deazaguanine synthase [Planctomycetes bacterium]|nr:7-cyano-7-deazaguanine synthase [Planctomycetota bacterium]
MSSMVILTGGGIKGAVSAAHFAKDAEILFVYVNYGQAAATSELKATEAIAREFSGAKVVRVDLPYMRKLSVGIEELNASAGRVGSSPGQGADTTGLSPLTLRGLMPVVVSVGLQTAIRVGANGVALGLSRHCDASHVGFPVVDGHSDALREFMHASDIMAEMLNRSRPAIRIECPVMDATYAEIVKLAHRYHLPLEKTWTCLKPGMHPCGACESCTARSRAMSDASHNDPALALARTS